MLNEWQAQSQSALNERFGPLVPADYSLAAAGIEPQSCAPEGDCGQQCCGPWGHGPTVRWPTGIELTFLRPEIHNNRAFDAADGGSGQQEFDYDQELSPRLWFGYEQCDGSGWRITWWQFDHDPDRVFAPLESGDAITSRAINGFEIAPDSTTDILVAASSLNAYTFDFEFTRHAEGDSWSTDASLGVRYGSTEQSYYSQIRNSSGSLQSLTNYNHWMRGVGPTVSLTAAEFVNCQTCLFARGRGSVLFGDHKWHLGGGDATDPLNIVLVNRDGRNSGTLTIFEAQAGVGWQADNSVCNPWQPFFTAAVEAQFWSDAGKADSTGGDVGFFGFTLGGGCRW